MYCGLQIDGNNIKIWHITVLVFYNQEQSTLEVSLWKGQEDKATKKWQGRVK